MPDRINGLGSLADFQARTEEYLARMKETGDPLVLSIDGKEELVVQDSASYQKLVERAGRAEPTDALQASIDDFRAGRVVPAEEMLAEMRKILAEMKRR